MASNRYILLTVVWLALGGGCDQILGKTLNSKFCEAHPDDSRCEDLRCDSSSECGALVCDVLSGKCVECTADEPSACMADKPVCGNDNVCRGCTAHSECSSAVCAPDGVCAAEADVAYVEGGRTGTPPCGKGAPCGTLGNGVTAVAAGKSYIKMSGIVKDNKETTIDVRKVVTILADPNTTLDRDGDGPVLVVRSANTNVLVYDLAIAGASGTSGNGVQLEPNGGDPQLSLFRVRVRDNQGIGIDARGGTLTVSQSTVASNIGGGISVDGAGAIVQVTNTFIARNGTSSATVGGASLRGAATGSVFALNTIVDNVIRAGTLAGGVSCEVVGFRVEDNLIVRNFVNNMEDLPNSNTAGACTFSSSTVASSVSGLNFVSPDETPFDYHIQAGSMAIDRATGSSSITFDVDGDARPQGSASDLGADEFR